MGSTHRDGTKAPMSASARPQAVLRQVCCTTPRAAGRCQQRGEHGFHLRISNLNPFSISNGPSNAIQWAAGRSGPGRKRKHTPETPKAHSVLDLHVRSFVFHQGGCCRKQERQGRYQCGPSFRGSTIRGCREAPRNATSVADASRPVRMRGLALKRASEC
jgi:hypothetical protein